MNTPYGDPWSQYPPQPTPGPPPSGPPAYGAPYGAPPQAGYPPVDYGHPPYGPGPVPPGGMPFPPYGPPPPPKSRTGLIIGLVIGAVALILLCGTGAVVALALNDDNGGSVATGGDSNSADPDPTTGPASGAAHKPLSNACAPAADVLKKKGLSIAEPREDSSTIGSVTLMFCSGPVGEDHFLGLDASVYAQDKYGGASPTERAVKDYDDTRKEAEDLSGTTRDLSGIGDKAAVRVRPPVGDSVSLELSALDGNMTISVRLTVYDMGEKDAIALASDLVKAYFEAA